MLGMIVLTAAAALTLIAPTITNLEDELAKASTIEAIQPDSALIEKLERTVHPEDEDVTATSEIDRSALPDGAPEILFSGNLPFYEYYSLKTSEYVIHPMRTGRFLVENATGTLAPDIADAVLSLAYRLPNDGLAWYYPRHYRVARMMGDKLKYSAISQGSLLAGFTELAAQNPSIGIEPARKTFNALLWPFEKGGVNLSGRAVLEMPSFAGAPEIILNGWIDALLHIRDYAEVTGDQRAADLFRKNIAFMAHILPVFDDREHTISRYSDLSPYRVKVTVARPEDLNTLQVLYKPKVDGIPSIRVPLHDTVDADNFSIYENQILRRNGRSAFVWLSCSQLYETVLTAKTKSLQVSTTTGVVDRKKSAPGAGGKELSLQGTKDNDLQYVRFGAQDGLICGYPTNFSKGGTHNYYHVYHIVGLMLIAMTNEVDVEKKKVLTEWALRWLDDMNHISRTEKLAFHPLQDMLDDINANQVSPEYDDFEKLLSDVRALN